MFNVQLFVAQNPDVPAALLAIKMGLRLDQKGLTKATRAKVAALHYLAMTHDQRVSRGLRDVACKEIGAIHARVKEAQDPSIVAAVKVQGDNKDLVDPVKRPGLMQATGLVPNETMQSMGNWRYMASPADLGWDGRSLFYLGASPYDGKDWAKRLGEGMAEAQRMVDSAMEISATSTSL